MRAFTIRGPLWSSSICLPLHRLVSTWTYNILIKGIISINYLTSTNDINQTKPFTSMTYDPTISQVIKPIGINDKPLASMTTWSNRSNPQCVHVNYEITLKYYSKLVYIFAITVCYLFLFYIYQHFCHNITLIKTIMLVIILEALILCIVGILKFVVGIFVTY